MSAKNKILVTRRMPDAVTARAMRDYDAELNPDDRIMPQDEWLARAEGKDALLIASSEKITAEVVGKLPDSVKVIATFSVGYEHIDVDAVKASGRVAANTPDVLNEAVADIAMLCLLGAARCAHAGQMLVRDDKWVGWHSTMLLGKDLVGARLGILGMGGIGRAIARRAKGFGLELHYHNRSRLSPELEQGAIYHADANSLAEISDFFSISCPSTDATRGMVNADLIARMPAGAVVVNTARGEIIDDDALIAALRGGHLTAAGLDVFTGEPAIDPRYRDLENVFLLPHLGSATVNTRDGMGFCCLDNLDAFFAGRPCPTAL